MPLHPGLLIPFGAVLILLLAAVVITSWYKRVPPNKFMIVYGKGDGISSGKIVTNGGKIVWPVINEAAWMSFQLYSLPVKVDRVPTKNLVPLTVDSVVQVRIKNEEESMWAAANLFLGRENDIPTTVVQVLEGKLREILATMAIEEVNQNRELFAQQVQDVAVQALAPMGLGIVNFSIREIMDHDEYLKSLSAKRVAEVTRDATIAEAEAAKEATVKSAHAHQEAETAKAMAEAAIGAANRDRDLKLIEFRRETEAASAEAEIAKAQRTAELEQKLVLERKRVELVAQEQDIAIAAKAVEAKEKRLDAEVRKPAEAKRYEAEQQAEADKYATIVTAEAQKQRAIAQAEAEAIATERKGKAAAAATIATQMAEADVKKAMMLAEAEGILAKGKAEAEAIRLAGLAKAEALEKEAEALAKMGEAYKIQLLVQALPNVAEALAKPLTQVDKIVLINTGDGSSSGTGIDKIFGDVAGMLPKLQETLKATTGVDLMATLSKMGAVIDIEEPSRAESEE